MTGTSQWPEYRIHGSFQVWHQPLEPGHRRSHPHPSGGSPRQPGFMAVSKFGYGHEPGRRSLGSPRGRPGPKIATPLSSGLA